MSNAKRRQKVTVLLGGCILGTAGLTIRSGKKASGKRMKIRC
jgi:hypothetical protein